MLVGIWARVQDLERKVFWPDEVLTAIRVSGHSLAAFRLQFDDQLHSVPSVSAFQIRDPRSNVGDVVSALAAEEPQHPPLFYVLDRFSIDLFGNSIAAYRWLSVLTGLLGIGCAFALGRAAFGSRTGGFVFAALVAVSPFHVHLSRQAREYELFSTIALGLSALLFWALAGASRLRWSAYAAVAALGLYTDPLFAGVIAAHAIVVAATQRSRDAFVGFAAACVAAAVAFVPWAVVLVVERDSAHAQLGWLAGTLPFKYYAEKWLFNFGTVAFDAELHDLRLAVVVVAFALVFLFAAVRAVRASFTAPRDPVAVLGLALTVLPLLLFGGYDLVERAHYTTVARYFAETAVGIEVLVATWLVACLRGRGRLPAFGLAAFAAIALAGIGSYIASAGAVNWWDNNRQVNYVSVASIVNQTPNPVVAVSDPSVALVLSHYLEPGARLLLVSNPATSAARLASIPDPAFLVAPSEELKAALARAGAHLEDRSPVNASPMADFRAGLGRERPDQQAALGPDSGNNALWAVRPGGHASPSEATSRDSSK